MNENEKIVQVPLDAATKAALDDRAAANGRAMGREAAFIIRREVSRQEGRKGGMIFDDRKHCHMPSTQ